MNTMELRVLLNSKGLTTATAKRFSLLSWTSFPIVKLPCWQPRKELQCWYEEAENHIRWPFVPCYCPFTLTASSTIELNEIPSQLQIFIFPIFQSVWQMRLLSLSNKYRNIAVYILKLDIMHHPIVPNYDTVE